MRGNLHHRENWLTLVVAFAIWGGHFIVIYAAALIFPESAVVIRSIVVVATLVAVGLLAARWHWIGRTGRSRIAILAIAIATMAVVFQTVPGLMV